MKWLLHYIVASSDIMCSMIQYY